MLEGTPTNAPGPLSCGQKCSPTPAPRAGANSRTPNRRASAARNRLQHLDDVSGPQSLADHQRIADTRQAAVLGRRTDLRQRDARAVARQLVRQLASARQVE